MIGGERGILIEGTKLIREALETGFPIAGVWYTQAKFQEAPGVIQRICDHAERHRKVSNRLMKSISEMDTPPGIVAVCSEPKFIYRNPDDPFSLIVVLSQTQDPGNVGGVIRTAEYFGVDEVWLGPGSADPYSPKAIRGSMGSVLRFPVIRLVDLAQRIDKFKRADAEVWGAVAHDKDAEMNMSATSRRILMFGSESRGLSREELNLTDKRVKIPGVHRAESLNQAVAAGILIYAATVGRYQQEQSQD